MPTDDGPGSMNPLVRSVSAPIIRRWAELAVSTASVLLAMVALLTAHLLASTPTPETGPGSDRMAAIAPARGATRSDLPVPSHLQNLPGATPAAAEIVSASESVSADETMGSAVGGALSVRFGWAGPDLTSSRFGGRASTVRLEAAEIDGNALPMASTTLVADDRWLEYRRGALVEWYARRHDLLVQGFTVRTAAPASELRIAVAFASPPGAELAPAESSSASFQAHDADGAALDVRSAIGGSRLTLWIDVTGARYPVFVGPITFEGNRRPERGRVARVPPTG